VVDYLTLLQSIDALHSQTGTISLKPAPSEFPKESIYEGQLSALETLICSSDALLCSHTGSGKTAVFTTLAHQLNLPTLIIEPRKFLQEQVHSYFPQSDVCIYGKSTYKCFYANSAASAPCVRKQKGIIEEFGIKRAATLFKVWNHTESKFDEFEYPCTDCPYILASWRAMNNLQHSKVVICNFGNFWKYLKMAQFIIIDEADAFFQSITAGLKLDYPNKEEDVTEVLTSEIHQTQKEISRFESLSPTKDLSDKDICFKLTKLQNHLESLQFFKAHAFICFTYKRKTKGTDSTYVEIDPSEVMALKERIFKGKRMLVVTATPSAFQEVQQVTYSIFQRAGIFYTPIGLMTRRNVDNGNEYLLEEAGDFIMTMYSIFEGKYGTKKCLVHCGNLTSYAKVLHEYIGKDWADLHTSGKLKETVENFETNNKRYLLLAGAEYGLDFQDNLQFILKMPYASMDDRLRALQKQMDPKEFNQWYEMDCINRFCQACGRVGRKYNDFAVTMVLDQKFKSLYYKYKDNFPEWFLNRLDPATY
jgi:hypothetical protein